MKKRKSTVKSVVGRWVTIDIGNDEAMQGHLLELDATGAVLLKTATEKLKFITSNQVTDIGASTVFVPATQIKVISTE